MLKCYTVYYLSTLLSLHAVDGDPMFIAPINLPMKMVSKLLGSEETELAICYEVHGAEDKIYNLVLDTCVSVNLTSLWHSTQRLVTSCIILESQQWTTKGNAIAGVDMPFAYGTDSGIWKGRDHFTDMHCPFGARTRAVELHSPLSLCIAFR